LFYSTLHFLQLTGSISLPKNFLSSQGILAQGTPFAVPLKTANNSAARKITPWIGFEL
jgi:hypothetical protein